MRHSSYRFLVPGTLLGLGVLISLYLFGTASAWQERNISTQVSQEAEVCLSAIREIMDDNLHALDAVTSFYASFRQVERHEFHEFVGHLFARYGGLQSLGWLQHVPGLQRNAFEAIVDPGFGAFPIIERTADDRLIKAGSRDECFPVQFIEPGEIGDITLGLDFAARSEWRSVLRSAGASGRKVAT